MKRNIVIDAFNVCITSAYEAVKRFPSFYEEEELQDSRVWDCLSKHLTRFKATFPNADTFYICWDSKGGKDFRKETDSNYKANRTHFPVSFSTIVGCKELFAQWGMINVEVEKAEADDVIYALCKILSERGDRNIIVSRDRDMIQTVQSSYAKSLWDPITRDFVEIPLYDIVVYKSLVGDSSDNIKGVKGIGPKKAQAIINGEIKLTEEQLAEYEKSRDLVDFKRNPHFEENYRAISLII
jgi:5'-3' exonuclease